MVSGNKCCPQTYSETTPEFATSQSQGCFELSLSQGTNVYGCGLQEKGYSFISKPTNQLLSRGQSTQERFVKLERKETWGLR